MSRAKLVASLLKKTILIFFIKNVLVYLGCVHTGFPGCSERKLLFLAEACSRAQVRECGSRAPERAFCSRGTWDLPGQGRACAPCTGRPKSLAAARQGSPNTYFLTAQQAPPPLGFCRQEHWSGLPLPSPGHESEKGKWSRSVVSSLGDPMDCSPPGSPAPGILQAGALDGADPACSSRAY